MTMMIFFWNNTFSSAYFVPYLKVEAHCVALLSRETEDRIDKLFEEGHYK